VTLTEREKAMKKFCSVFMFLAVLAILTACVSLSEFKEWSYRNVTALGSDTFRCLAGDVDEVRVKVEWGYSVAADESRMWSHGDNLIYIGVTCYVIEDGKKIGHMDEVACDPTKPPGKGPCSDVVRWIMRQEENGKVLTDGNNTVASLFPDTWKE